MSRAHARLIAPQPRPRCRLNHAACSWRLARLPASCVPTTITSAARMRINFGNVLIIRHPIAMMLACFLFGGLAIAFAGSKRITYSDMMRERVERLVGYDLPDDLNPSSQERRRRTPLLDQMQGYMFHPGDSQIEELMDTCEERGGEILDRAGVMRRAPKMRSVPYHTDICFREGRSGEGMALIYEKVIVVRLPNY